MSKEKKDTRPNNSKFKLTEEEQKEHVDNNLCFKCHKKGHSSKDCKGTCTIYSEFKMTRTQVSNVETKENEPKTKGKARARIKEVATKEENKLTKGEQEDFTESN
jgi:hypothetical protein